MKKNILISTILLLPASVYGQTLISGEANWHTAIGGSSNLNKIEHFENDLGASFSSSSTANFDGFSVTANGSSSGDVLAAGTEHRDPLQGGNYLRLIHANDGESITFTMSAAVTSLGFAYRQMSDNFHDTTAVFTFSDASTLTLSPDTDPQFGEDGFVGVIAPAGQTLTKIDFNPTSSNDHVGVDPFQMVVTETVPEPSSTALLGLGALGLLARRKRN